MSENSTFLFANPSFFEGISRLFDFGNSLSEYNRSKSGSEADYRALKNDWSAIGNDIIISMEIYEQESSEELSKSRQ